MSHVGGLELLKVGVLIPRKLADMASEGFFTGELAIINTQLALGESNIRRCELGVLPCFGRISEGQRKVPVVYLEWCY